MLKPIEIKVMGSKIWEDTGVMCDLPKKRTSKEDADAQFFEYYRAIADENNRAQRTASMRWVEEEIDPRMQYRWRTWWRT